MKRISIWILLALFVAACETEQPTAPVLDEAGPPPATQSFRVLALGNSLSAGYMHNGLAAPGQLASFPNLIARQIWPTALAGMRPHVGVPGMYVQMPLVAYSPAQGVRGVSSTLGKGALYVNPSGQVTQDDLVVAPTNPAFASTYLLNARLPVPYDNLGIPGAYSLDVGVTTDATNSVRPGNAFFDMILRPGLLPATTQLSQFEMAGGGMMVIGLEDGNPVYGSVPPMLATIWVGNNDILLGATTGDPNTGENMTAAGLFETALKDVLDGVQALGIPMVAIANIPDITAIPFFTAIPGGSWTSDETDVQLVTLNARGLPGFPAAYYPNGGSSLPSSVTLTATEVAEVTELVVAYNDIIEAEATTRQWALVDVNAVLNDLESSPTGELNGFFPWGSTGQNMTSAFTLDGIHPSEKGQAHLANSFLAAINTHYAGALPAPLMPFPSVDLATVDNVSGFEVAPSPPDEAAAKHRPLFTLEGARALWWSTVRSEPPF